MSNSQGGVFYTDTSPMAGVSGLQYLAMQSAKASGNPSASWFYNIENQAASQQQYAPLTDTVAPSANTTNSSPNSWLNWIIGGSIVALVGIFVYLKYFREG